MNTSLSSIGPFADPSEWASTGGGKPESGSSDQGAFGEILDGWIAGTANPPTPTPAPIPTPIPRRLAADGYEARQDATDGSVALHEVTGEGAELTAADFGSRFQMTELRPAPASLADLLSGRSISVSAEAVEGPTWLRMPPTFALPVTASGPAIEGRASDLGTVVTPALPDPGRDHEEQKRVGEGAIPATLEGDSESVEEASTTRPAVGTVLVPEPGVTSREEAKAVVGQLPAVLSLIHI